MRSTPSCRSGRGPSPPGSHRNCRPLPLGGLRTSTATRGRAGPSRAVLDPVVTCLPSGRRVWRLTGTGPRPSLTQFRTDDERDPAGRRRLIPQSDSASVQAGTTVSGRVLRRHLGPPLRTIMSLSVRSEERSVQRRGKDSAASSNRPESQARPRHGEVHGDSGEAGRATTPTPTPARAERSADPNARLTGVSAVTARPSASAITAVTSPT